MAKTTAKPQIQYPTWKVSHRPTPTDTLFICDLCCKAVWSWYNVVPQCYCTHGRKGGAPRMRRATEEETAEGKKCLVTIIGDANKVKADEPNVRNRYFAGPEPPGAP